MIVDWILLQNRNIIYLSLFVILIGSALGVPIPEDLPLIAAGIALNNNLVALLPTFLICYTSIIAGDSIVYFIGYRLGPKLFEKKWFKSRVSASHIRNTRLSLYKRSWLMIFIARHLFYLRTATFLVCGAVKMPFRRFILIDICAACFSTVIMISFGYLASEHWQSIRKIFQKFELLGIIPLLIILYFIFKKRKPTRRSLLNESTAKPLRDEKNDQAKQ